MIRITAVIAIVQVGRWGLGVLLEYLFPSHAGQGDQEAGLNDLETGRNLRRF